jgi:tRNA U34 2-thiouridine synthase MnmA/TrmU
MKILVALSGGIDSSVVAHLLKEQGHELIGVRFTLWSDPLRHPLHKFFQANAVTHKQLCARV